MTSSILLYGGQSQATDEVLITLLLYEHELHQQIRLAARNGFNLFQYLPSINLSELVLDAPDIPGEDAGEDGALIRDLCQQRLLQMIVCGTRDEAQRALHRIRRELTAHRLEARADKT